MFSSSPTFYSELPEVLTDNGTAVQLSHWEPIIVTIMTGARNGLHVDILNPLPKHCIHLGRTSDCLTEGRADQTQLFAVFRMLAKSWLL